MNDAEDDYQGQQGILSAIKDAILYPIHIALSPALLRTYLRTALVLFTSSILFGIAIVAYSTFYYTYIPIRGISVPVYLQFDPTAFSSLPDVTTASQSRFPYGIATIDGLISKQKYDVLVDLEMPRSTANLGAGNWMVGVEMRAPTTASGAPGAGKGLLGWDEEWDMDGAAQTASNVDPLPTSASSENPVVLARSRRPAILTFRSWVTEHAYRALRLPLYVVGWGHEEEKVSIRMMEGVEFEKGWRSIPSSVRVEIRSRTSLEIYKATVRFVAKLEGLRWIMFHYKLTSFVVFTGLFWGVEMTLVLATWGIFTLLFGGAQPVDEELERKRLKQESRPVTPKTEPVSSEPQTPLSDTSRTFPTLHSQTPLHYSSGTASPAKLKEERATPALDDIPREGDGEADDEDEDADFILNEPVPTTAASIVSDSGIGTSMESSREGDRGLVRRRSGKMER